MTAAHGTVFRRTAAASALALAAAVALVLLYRVNPEGSGLFPKCPFHEWTGLACPGCGSTRAAHHLLHGRVLTALRLNPLIVVIGPMLAYASASELREMSGRRPLPPLFASTARSVLLFLLVVLFWVVRNLPFGPFSRLSP